MAALEKIHPSQLETAEAAQQRRQQQMAIALAYGAGDFAPRVVAKGKGLIAEQIVAKAKEHQVFVHESKELVALLMQVDLDDHIPPQLYLAIAEILAWLYQLENGLTEAPLVHSQAALTFEENAESK